MAKSTASVIETSLISAGDRAGAIEDLKSAEKLANEIKGGKFLVSEAGNLLAEIEKVRDEAYGITKNTAKQLAELGTETEALFNDGQLLYALDFEKGTLFSVDPQAGTKATLIEALEIEGKINFATYIKSRKVIYVYTEGKEAYELNPRTKRATMQNTSAGWEDAIAADSYLSSVYLLSPAESKIYKHQKLGVGYGRKVNYFKEDVSITDAVDLAIDSDVYVLSASGEVQKFTAGIPQTYQITGLPVPIAGATELFTSPETEGLYIATPGQVTKIDGKQKFVASYQTDSIKKIKGLSAIDKNQTIYVQSEGKIFSIAF